MSTISRTHTLAVLDGKAALDRHEASHFLSVSPSTLARLTEMGKVRSRLVGSSRRWLVEDLVAYLKALP